MSETTICMSEAYRYKDTEYYGFAISTMWLLMVCHSTLYLLLLLLVHNVTQCHDSAASVLVH
jgi:hypothetical protein